MTTVTVTRTPTTVSVTSDTAATVETVSPVASVINENQATIATTLTDVNTIESPAWIQFNTTSSPTIQTGRMGWDTEFETLQVGVNAGAVLQLGQEMHQIVQNDSGAVIADGTAVQVEIDGDGRIQTVGLGFMRVVPAIADGSVRSTFFLGLVTTDIAEGDRGMVTSHGYVNFLDTQTPGWTLGDVLWVDPAVAGGLTNVEPVGGNVRAPIGVVTRVNIQTGSIYVRFNPNPSVEQLNDVSVSNLQNGDVLKWDAADSAWKNGQP